MSNTHQVQHRTRLKLDGSERDRIDSEFLRRKKAPSPAIGPDFEIVDLFAGCGGLSIGAIEGARRAGAQAGLALAVDNDSVPLTVLQESLRLPDRCVETADLSDALGSVSSGSTRAEQSLFAGICKGPLLLAGPPCQGHSALNNHTRHDDPRNDLYLAVGRVARILKPTAAIVENVRGVGSDRRSSVARCTSVLEELGYHVDARRIDLATIGVPQQRVRHVLVATKGNAFDWGSLPLMPPRDLRWAIEDLDDIVGSTLIDTPSTPTPVNRKRMEWLHSNDALNLPNELRPVCHQSNHSYRSMYGRLRWDAPAQTITSGFGSMGQGRYVHPSRPRTLTPHEAARLQFLPDYMTFASVKRRGQLAQMIGNAAPPLLTCVLVEAMIDQQVL
jgi:DNA (cytosine-5)-methyltransferase 1